MATISPAEQLTTVAARDGTPIAYWRVGDGPPLVLVHGTTADHTRWRTVLAPLAERFSVYAIDRRGRGASGDQPAYALEREFEDVAAVVDSLPSPVTLLGHSYGALCSLEAALLTAKIGRLILYEPPLPTGVQLYPPGFINRLQVLLDQGHRDAVVSTFFSEILHMPPDQLALMQSLPAWQGRVAAAHTIVRELHASEDYVFDFSRFERVELPILLLLGGDSPAFLKAATEAAQRALRNAEIGLMPGQQHAAMDTGPDVFLEVLFKWLT